MCIAKTVREYIENKVSEAYRPKKNALRADYDAKKRAVQDELEALREKWNAEAKAVIAKHNLSVDTRYNSDTLRDIVLISDYYGDSEWQPINQAIKAVDNECCATIQNIIVEMELGGNREKLEEMLAAIGEK